MNTNNNHQRPFYFTLFDYLSDSKQLSSQIIEEIKPYFYLEKVEFPQQTSSRNVATLFIYYLDETKWEEYQDILEIITILLGCENMITINMDNDHNLETIKTMNYKVFLEIMYLKNDYE